ncbi:hypothetical protein F0U44_01840 [Nocardioides humilatus]|uniref:LPXTG cell wall anchor domain-containing protein n=1 Tax=Nocardioides humilatus TaxID=2607660 RepID=A0A5B1LN80_9ACTN|nr:hypothetical protein [Nocardioides humilatus]KAA1421089.1 hypothetical protein F0U44_01840 [Nocardioides humilatus]
MRGTVLLAGAILGAATLIGAPTSSVAAPDPYTGGITTECNVSVPGNLEAGEKIKIKVNVNANSPTPPTGKITLVVLAGPGGGVARRELTEIWSKTVNYSGGTKTVVGPALQAAQHYKVGIRFRPGDDTFLRCAGGVLFGVEAAGDNNHNPDGPGGLLPDTGGPALLWLILGMGLVGGGAGTVVYARRRTAPATV